MTARGSIAAMVRRVRQCEVGGWPDRAALVACVLVLGACRLDEADGYSLSDADPVAERWQPGLATAYNAAILADNPRDLDRPRRETPRDAARRDALTAAYRSEGVETRGTSTQNKGGQ